jgi:two-component system cell cycle sensor histidine kinase/response regulator CckA
METTFWHHVPEEEHDAVRRHLASLDREKPANLIEHRVYRAGGEMRWQQRTDRAILNADGRVVEFQAVGRDITDKRKAEEAMRDSERRFRELAGLLPETVFETDEKGVLIFLNAAGFETFGYTQSDFDKGIDLCRLISDEHIENAKQRFRRMLEGQKLAGAEYTAL